METREPDTPVAPGKAELGGNPLLLAGDCLRALAELALARRALASISVAQIKQRNHRASQSGRPPKQAAEGDMTKVRRIAAVLPRVAGRVPWRSDCLVQAMAAQRWLAAHGIATQILIGADRPPETGFEAHAWLQYGEMAVTGGETGRFAVLI